MGRFFYSAAPKLVVPRVIPNLETQVRRVRRAVAINAKKPFSTHSRDCVWDGVLRKRFVDRGEHSALPPTI
jgi:hypothetical protein